MTLIELTVVILVLLSLIGVLFLGANAWKNGSDRVLCILNLQSVQKGVRSYSNLNGRAPGETVPGLQSEVIGLGRFVEAMPECPAQGSYTTTGDTIPMLGSLYLECSLGTSGSHVPANAEDW
ncbi:hypothetical protein OKA04_11530 [Luteolibacter flavescens]|uniref:Type II secretion system protein n=1 Tax=Luteolibacter flavescens TaxID=1859460 RepID=A0ABT3FP66_9BACT|nr:hypothetical protein [Luteolibacter flavescens]MCW1885361.1 hypothetical protein [Luteolibacter flavescens]